MASSHKEGDSYWLRPVEKKERRELPISDRGKAEVGDLFLRRKPGVRPGSARASIPFWATVRAAQLQPDRDPQARYPARLPRSRPRRGGARLAPDLGPREDLTHIPIVAIDPADARDHDDAVWAAPDDDASNPGGWKAIVAIADVSFYVRSGSALRQGSAKAGNSVYFPDQVVPMLPETLSASICSLKQGEDRAALACNLQISKDGQSNPALHPRPRPHRGQPRL